MRMSVISAISLVLLSGCTQKPQTVARQTVIDAIQKAEEAQAAALARHDLDGAYAVFADDSRLYMTGMPPAIGRDAIKAANERALKDPAFRAVFDRSESRGIPKGRIF